MTRALPFALALALSACASYAPPTTEGLGEYAQAQFDAGQPVVIWNNYGGNTGAPIWETRLLMRHGLMVRVEGECDSACTLLLLEPHGLCYAPDAEFKFHGFSNRGEYDPEASKRAADEMPPKLSQWISANKAMSSPDVITTIPASEMAKLDATDRTCRS